MVQSLTLIGGFLILYEGSMTWDVDPLFNMTEAEQYHTGETSVFDVCIVAFF